jgi:hypothetical protein
MPRLQGQQVAQSVNNLANAPEANLLQALQNRGTLLPTLFLSRLQPFLPEPVLNLPPRKSPSLRRCALCVLPAGLDITGARVSAINGQPVQPAAPSPAPAPAPAPSPATSSGGMDVATKIYIVAGRGPCHLPDSEPCSSAAAPVLCLSSSLTVRLSSIHKHAVPLQT